VVGLGDKIADKLVDSLWGGALWIVGSLIPGLLYSQKYPDPFYHAGWLHENRAWLPFFLLVWFFSLCAVFRVWGLVAVGVILAICVVIFGLYYSGSSALSDNLQLALWVVHGVAYSMFPGALAGGVLLVLKWMGKL
jgi:hypothetical protein